MLSSFIAISPNFTQSYQCVLIFPREDAGQHSWHRLLLRLKASVRTWMHTTQLMYIRQMSTDPSYLGLAASISESGVPGGQCCPGVIHTHTAQAPTLTSGQ